MQWLVFENGLILVSLGFGYFCGGLCAGMVLVWVGGGVRRDGLGHLDSEVAFHRSRCRSSIGSFLLRFMQNMADRICSAQLQLCFCSAVSIGCIKLASSSLFLFPHSLRLGGFTAGIAQGSAAPRSRCRPSRQPTHGQRGPDTRSNQRTPARESRTPNCELF